MSGDLAREVLTHPHIIPIILSHIGIKGMPVFPKDKCLAITKSGKRCSRHHKHLCMCTQHCEMFEQTLDFSLFFGVRGWPRLDRVRGTPVTLGRHMASMNGLWDEHYSWLRTEEAETAMVAVD